MKFSLPIKLVLIFFFLSAMGVAGVTYLSYINASNSLQKQALANLSNDLKRESSILTAGLTTLREDAIFLSELPSISGIIRSHQSDDDKASENATENYWETRLAAVFKTVLKQRQAYTQVRFIGNDHNGHELVRVNRVGDQVHIVSEGQLQKKGGAGYFESTMQLNAGETYLSRVTYNRERGRIALPLQPVIRIGVPVFDAAGVVFGAVIINVDFNLLAKSLLKSNGSMFYFLTNDRGDYLIHPDKDKRLAFELGQSALVTDDYPIDLNTVANKGHLFEGLNVAEQNVGLVFHRLYFDPLNQERFFLIGSVTNHDVILKESLRLAQQLIAIVLVAVLILSILAWFVVRYLTKPLVDLRLAADRISSGDENVDFPIKGNDEISDLAHSFKEMLSRLGASNRELSRLTSSLESKVLNRTQALQTATERLKHTLEESESLRESAEQANVAKSEFLASMSHEIRTPMNGVLGMLNLLKNEELTKEQLQKVQVAQSSAESLLILINDILDFSKIDAGKLDLETLDFNIHNVMGEFVESMAWRCEEKGIELILDVTDVTQTTFRGDPGRIRQILTNLVGNAIKFTEQGEIVIRASIGEDNLTASNNEYSLRLTCSVSDTGVGIPEEKLHELFDAFTQADSSTTREYGGTGLGLSIVKRLCALMGGDVRVTSEVGKGSVFEFSIRLAPSAQSKLVMPEINTQNLSLLIVDDNLTNRQVLSGQLEIWGCNVCEAVNGEESLSILNERMNNLADLGRNVPFDVAFIDMQMPGMDGAELGRRIRADKRFDGMKLVMMTSMGHKGDAKFFADLGFSAYFSKPTTTSDLFDALAVVVEGGAALEQAKPLVTHHYLKTLVKKSQNESWPEHARILVVEDNMINQMVAKELLSQLGLAADTAANGQEAIEVLSKASTEASYILVLMDCQMPIMDGYESSRKIRSGEAGALAKTIPIIAMTANAMKGDKEKCLEAGMDDYLSKPINPDTLEAKLRQWIFSDN